MMMRIVRLEPENAEALRALRREALALHPSAFTADPDIENELVLDDWRERIRQNACFGALDCDELVAIATLLTEPSKKIRHTARLVSTYVRESHRGTGLADGLIDTVLVHTARYVEQVMLSVEAAIRATIRFYERHSFRLIGSIPRSILIDDNYLDELQTLLTLPRRV